MNENKIKLIENINKNINIINRLPALSKEESSSFHNSNIKLDIDEIELNYKYLLKSALPNRIKSLAKGYDILLVYNNSEKRNKLKVKRGLYSNYVDLSNQLSLETLITLDEIFSKSEENYKYNLRLIKEIKTFDLTEKLIYIKAFNKFFYIKNMNFDKVNMSLRLYTNKVNLIKNNSSLTFTVNEDYTQLYSYSQFNILTIFKDIVIIGDIKKDNHDNLLKLIKEAIKSKYIESYQKEIKGKMIEIAMLENSIKAAEEKIKQYENLEFDVNKFL